jgi:succinate dehydrogenase/fumarate reductase flavoprotein subunit
MNAKNKTRRDFVKTGAAAGVGARAFAGLLPEPANAQEMIWDREFDVVVVGAGAGGMAAAIAARDEGASVILVEQNFDIGGRAILSGAAVYLGGGTSLQKAAGIEDSPQQVFYDWCLQDQPRNRYNDRELAWTYVEKSIETFDFLTENGVDWESLEGRSPDRNDSVPRRPTPRQWPIESEVIVPAQKGSGLMRPLAKSAREKGVVILLQHKMTSFVREQPTSGRVIGITAVEVDEWFKLQDRTTNIRARKGVIFATGTHAGNVEFRRIFDPRLTEEYQAHGDGWTELNADGPIAALAIGASLWGTAIQTNEADAQLSKGRLATRSNYHALAFPPTAPNFFREKATGLSVRNWQNVILVKETGLRFYNETAGVRDYEYFAAAMAWTGDLKKLNGGGPIWAIFDADGAERERWNVTPPDVDPDGYFYTANTLEELAAKIDNKYQWRPMPGTALRETVERYNSFVDSGVDDDFKKPTPRYKIQRPPFYAAWATPCVHESYAGVRINTKAQVMDMNGEVIPGLYAAGEAAGGYGQHGLGRCFVYGRIAGIDAARSSAA